MLAACGGGKPSSTPTATSLALGIETPAADKPTVEPTAVVNGNPSNEAIAFAGSDGFELKGHLYTTPGPKRRALIIVSESPQSSYDHIADYTAADVAVLTYDQRGVGETGGSPDSSKLGSDLEVAYRLLKSRDYPLLYVFASGNGPIQVALQVASRQNLAGVVTYGDPGPDANASRVPAPKLFIVDAVSPDAGANVDRVLATASGTKRKLILQAGVSDAELRQSILSFITE